MKGCFDLKVASKTYRQIFVNVSLLIFHSGLEDLLMKTHFSTAVILLCDPIHISYLNTILMLCDCVGERRHWRSYFDIGLAYKLKSPASTPKCSCALLIRKDDSLGELGHQ